MWKTLLLFITSLTCVASQYDCNAGCSLDASVMGPPVCDGDGLTYANECIAFCQGIVQYSYGSCDGNKESRIEEFAFSGDAEVITMEIMNRFAQESFRFVTKRTDFASQLDEYENVAESDLLLPLDMPQRRHSLRITSEGYEFMAPMDSIASTTLSTTAYKGLGDDYRRYLREREMIIIGEDTRSIVGDTTIFPFRAIGAADYTTGKSVCTVTMISRTSALTAAHCVWRKSTNQPQPMTAMAPGRYFDPSLGRAVEPFGTWEVDYMTTFHEYEDFGVEAYDMAVVTYKPANRPDLGCTEAVYPGDVVGYVGIDRVAGTSTAVNDPRLATITVTGYPSDYKSGQMVTSGPCSRNPLSGGPHYIWHFCDTVAGQSGSALLTDQNILLGNHAHGNWVSSRNGGPVLNGNLYDAVFKWAGLGEQHQQPIVCSASNECPCLDSGNPSQRALCWFLNFQSCFRVATENANNNN